MSELRVLAFPIVLAKTATVNACLLPSGKVQELLTNIRTIQVAKQINERRKGDKTQILFAHQLLLVLYGESLMIDTGCILPQGQTKAR